MAKRRDVTGERFGRLIAVRYLGTSEGRAIWEFHCDCGNSVDARVGDVVSGKQKSCGCLRREASRANGRKIITHGMAGTRLWNIWNGMKRRCKVDPHYQTVIVCDEWKAFEPFRDWALANGYSEALTLDRIDPYGNYEPSNCRWATYKQQENNRRNTVRITVNGETKPLTAWAECTGIPAATLAWRINAGWPEEDLFMPVNLNNKNIRKERRNNVS